MLADLVADLLVSEIGLGADAEGAELLGDGESVIVYAVGNRHHLDLIRGYPGREGAHGLLDEVCHKAVEGAEDSAVEDDGGLLRAVAVDIGELELRGQAEVELAGGEGVLSADCGADVNVELRAVEGGLAYLLGKVDAELNEHFAQGSLGGVPHLVVRVVLHLVRGVAEGEDAAVIGDAEILIALEDKVADLADLVLYLLGRHEEVGVVLAEVAAALDALEGAGGLVAEVVCYLADAEREVAVGVRLVGVDHHMVRAIHRAEHVGLLVDLHRGEHILLIVIPVAGGLVELHGADAGGHNVLIAELQLLIADIVFKLAPDRVAAGQEHRHAPSDEVVGHKELHILAYLAMVALFRLLEAGDVGVELLLLREGDAVYPLKALAGSVAAPVARVAGQKLYRVALYPAGRVEVRAGAEVCELALAVEAYRLALGQVVY